MKPSFPAFSGSVMAALAGLCGLSGCGGAETFLHADVEAIEIDASDTGDHAVTIFSSSSWMIDTSGGGNWLEVWYDSKDPNLIWAKALTKNESLEARTAEITVVSGDGLFLAIPFGQLEMVVSFEVTPMTVEPFGPRDPAIRTFTVSTDLTWEASAKDGADWIVLTQGTDDQGTVNSLTLGVKSTRDFDERHGSIVIQPVNPVYREEYSVTVGVVQEGIGLVVSSETLDEETYIIDIPAGGGEVPLLVSSKEAWTLTTDADPKAVSFDLTAGKGDIENGIPVVMTVAGNTSGENHEYTLVFESAGETYEYICRQRSDPPQRQV